MGRCKLRWLNIDKNYILYNTIQDSLKWFKWTWCYFKKYYYSNLWIIHVQSPINLSKFVWKLVFNVVDHVFFKFGSLKRKTHKVHRNNAPSKTFKKYVFGIMFLKNKQKLQLIWTIQPSTIQKFLTTKWLRFSKKRFLAWVYHLVLHYILNPNNEFGMWIKIKISILWFSIQMTSPYFFISKVHYYYQVIFL
jgi:hypothetical protein